MPISLTCGRHSTFARIDEKTFDIAVRSVRMVGLLKIVMKTMCLPSAMIFGIAILMNGCSKPEPAASVEKKAESSGYQLARPSAFASQNIQPGGRCFVDSFNGQPVSPRNEAAGNGTLAIDGWGIDSANTAAPLVAVELAPQGGGASYYAPAARATRPGLGQALKDAALDRAGLDSTASLAGVPAGSYSVEILIGDAKSASRCDPNLLLVVK